MTFAAGRMEVLDGADRRMEIPEKLSDNGPYE